jgi:hypothetical protein
MTTTRKASWSPPIERTRAEIAGDLNKSQQAAQAIPALQTLAAQEEKHKKELERWEQPFREKRAQAISTARDLVNQIKEEEAVLARHLKAEVESPMFRAARSLIRIADLRSRMQDQVLHALTSDFERAHTEVTEDGSEASLLRVKSITAATVSADKIANLLRELDPTWSPVRGLVGPERDVAEIVMGLLWPKGFEREKPDSGGKGQ